ncbi:hypothetical protein MNBD_DELTA01-2044 [hydrothermal vent metagenome]|uniref:FxsA protein n=1 Tax=hydrothermal vent metagenome TaxID=652676 RepID=A0A3B0R6G2_9ZZZZ
MFGRLLLLFLIIPVVELALLIKIGTVIGTLNTILLVIFTAFIGAYLVKTEGLNVMERFQSNLGQGIFPAEEIFDGAIILVAGALLVTPGVITDFVGFVLVIPPSRAVIKKFIRKFVEKRFVTTHINYPPGNFKD